MTSAAPAYLTATNSMTGITSVLDSLPKNVNGFYFDGMAFNSNTHHLYVHYLDTNNFDRLMDIDVSSSLITFNDVTISNLNDFPTNFSMEFDLSTNLLHFFSIETSLQTQAYKMYFGILDLPNGVINYKDSLDKYNGYILSTATYDQAGQNMCMLVLDSLNNITMAGYQVATNNWFEAPIPSPYIYEIEADNFAYIQAKYSINSVKEETQELIVYPNPVNHSLHCSGVLVGEAYQILTIQGNFIRHGKMESLEEQIGVSDLANGVYIIHFPQTNNNKKFIVKHD
jgi:hypothetical protein